VPKNTPAIIGRWRAPGFSNLRTRVGSPSSSTRSSGSDLDIQGFPISPTNGRCMGTALSWFSGWILRRCDGAPRDLLGKAWGRGRPRPESSRGSSSCCCSISLKLPCAPQDFRTWARLKARLVWESASRIGIGAGFGLPCNFFHPSSSTFTGPR